MVHRSDIFYANGKGIGLVRGRLFEKTSTTTVATEQKQKITISTRRWDTPATQR